MRGFEHIEGWASGQDAHVQRVYEAGRREAEAIAVAWAVYDSLHWALDVLSRELSGKPAPEGFTEEDAAKYRQSADRKKSAYKFLTESVNA